MDKKFWELVCDEHGIRGDGKYCGAATTTRSSSASRMR
jgi:hypothetical protein